MAIQPIPAFPALSDRADGSYNSKAFAWAKHMESVFVSEANALAANLNSIAAGGAYAIPYNFSSTAGGYPGAGWLRFDTASQNSAASINVTSRGAGAQDVRSEIADMGNSTSAVKGRIRLQKVGDASKWMTFNVNSVGGEAAGGDGAYYRTLYVTAISASAVNPFSQGDMLMLFFQRTGDKGDLGPSAYALIGSYTASSDVANITFNNLFTSAYDKYVIEVQNHAPSSNDLLSMRVITSAGTSTSYVGPLLGSGATTPNTTSAMVMGNSSYLQTTSLVGSSGPGMTIEVRNVNGTGGKSISARGVYFSSSTAVNVDMHWAHNPSSVLTGLQLLWNAGSSFKAGSVVRVYGIKNS